MTSTIDADGDKTISFEVFFGVSSPWACLGAPQAYSFGDKYGLTINLRPMLVIEANGGIRLANRTKARQDYHALDLRRTADKLGIPLISKPKYYPQDAIAIAAQAICRVQHALGQGTPLAIKYTWAIQNSLWLEEGNVYDVEHLKSLGRKAGLDEVLVESAIIDNRQDSADEGVKQWRKNLKDAEDIGCFGTPNYVVNGEIFWGRDRLDDCEDRIKVLLSKGYKPL